MKNCIVVLGMHRSGTSALAGVLNILGIHLGPKLIPPASDNPKGFFENVNITLFNEKLLESFQSSWDDLFPLPEKWWEKQDLEPYKEEAITILKKELNQELFGMKDPRLCIVLPFWQTTFEKLHINPHYLICIRNPLEIVESLKMRNSFSPEKSLLLWIYYMINAEFYSRNAPRAFVVFDDLLRHPEKTLNIISKNLGINFPKAYCDVRNNIEQFLEPDLKHYTLKENEVNVDLLELLSYYYNLLLTLANTGEIGSDKVLEIDKVREQYLKIHKLFYHEEIINHQRKLNRVITKRDHAKGHVRHLQNTVREKDAEKVALVNQLNQTISEKEALAAEKDSIANQLNQSITEKDTLRNRLNAIFSSDFWIVASFYYKLRDGIPFTRYLHSTLRCLRREGFKTTLRKLKNKRKKEVFEKVQGTVMAAEKATDHIMNTPEYKINPYANLKLLKDIQVSVLDIDFNTEKILTPFSLITTIRNESTSIVDFLKSIEYQILRPHEIIIVDGGSTDNTIELVEDYKIHSKLNIKLIKSSPINIAQGRNIGIRESSNEILVLTDAGCRLDRNFCKNLVGCFSYLGNIDLAGGIYKLMHEFPIFSIDWQSINWQEFIPSARSIAIKKTLALRAGGFPEFLTLTGEDTLFDINYRRISNKWAFNRKSVIYWNSPKTDDEAYKVAFSYGRGDGESGMGDFRFHETFYEQLKLYSFGYKIDIKDPFRRGLFLGYLEGRKNRSHIEIYKRNITGVVLILSEAPFVKSGDESTRIAIDLIYRGYKVIFVSVNHLSPKENKVWFDTDYTLLELYYAHDFNWEEFIEGYRKVQEKTFILYKYYHPVLASIVEKLKAKTGNKIKVISDSSALDEDTSSVKRESSLEEGNTFKDLSNAAHADETLRLTPNGDNSNSHEHDDHDSVFARRSAVNLAPISRNLAFSALGETLQKLISAVKNCKFMLNFLKFRYYSQNYGFEEALRRSYHKLKKVVSKDQQKAKQDMIIKSDMLLQPILFQTRNGCSFDIISFPIMPWFSRFQRSQQLLTKFAANGTRVFRIDRGFLLDNKTRYIPEKVHENILQVTLNSRRDFNIYTDFIDDESLNRMLRSFNDLRMDYMISNAVCIPELPFWYPLAKNLKERYGWEIVYDCMDEHEGFSTNNNQMFSVESKLAMESSLIVVTSNYLYEKMAGYNRNCVLIPNATDFEHFHHLPENDLLTDVKKPIIGYYGALSEWFDAELIEHAAITKKDWNFIIIGGKDSGINLSTFKKLPNVRLLGEKPYSELPKYLYWFDVCLIPFKLSKLTEATNPVKFYEYISSGKPVVSVRLPELFPFADYLYLANDKEDFIRKIEAALEENDPELLERRITFAKENTWEKRYEALKRNIENIYPKVSIIIVTYNNLSFTKACVESIYSRSQYPNFELIIVDNNSQDGTKNYLSGISDKYTNIKFILNDYNKGFASANNQAIKMADGDYIILLNNDTIVTPGWISKLLRYLEDKSIGMVGPRTNMCGNEAIIFVSYDVVTLEGFEEFVREYYRAHSEPAYFEIDMLSMFCIALRRETIDEIGLLDERFKVGTFEDTDYSKRLKVNGYKLICAKDVFIHHHCRASFGKLLSKEYMRIYAENRKKFEEKWGEKSRY